MKIWKDSVELAFRLAKQKRSQHIAFIYHKRKLVSIGRNNKEIENAKAVYFANQFQIQKWKQYPYIHAEIDAVSKIWGQYYLDKNYTLISLRIGDNKLWMAKPCSNCEKVIKAIGMKTLYCDSSKNMKIL